MNAPRKVTRRIQLGPVAIGNGAPVSVQTMAKCDGRDTATLLNQIAASAEMGCDIFRVAVPDLATAEALAEVVKKSPLPLVADIHFDHRLALASLKSGVAGLRINPGNIGGRDAIRAVVAEAKPCHAPIRIGVNGGSLEKDLLEKHGGATAEALVESALRHVALLEAEDFFDIKISVKASDITRTLAAYRLLAERTDYPLHLGLTEAGTFLAGTMRSTFALGTLLAEGIGDTIRISLTDTPEREVRVGVELLRMLGLRSPGASVTSCPTCGRTQVDVRRIAEEIEARLEKFYRENPNAPRPHIAVMGCRVNGPGEARDADIALIGGSGRFALCVKGENVVAFPESEAAARVVDEVRRVQWK